MTDKTLDRLCALAGIESQYTDGTGRPHRVGDETKRALLAAMGIPAENEATMRCALQNEQERRRQRVLAPAQVARISDGPPIVRIALPAGRAEATFGWTLSEENGRRTGGEFRPCDLDRLEQSWMADAGYRRFALGLPRVPEPGYHHFKIHAAAAGGVDATMLLIVAPDAGYRPEALAGDGRAWGLGVQVPGLRSGRNWGIGDLGDLLGAVDLCAKIGAGVLELSPTHALYPGNPAHADPYVPSSRLYRNILFLDLEAIPEVGECAPARELLGSTELQARLRALRAAEQVDYPAVAEVKLDILERLYRHFRERHLLPGTERGEAFRAYQSTGGEVLRRHGLFYALQARFSREDPDIRDWTAWPEPFQDPGSDACARFQAEHLEQVEFCEYLQWETQCQMERVGRRSHELGLGIGLCPALACAPDFGGAEVWANPGLFARNVRLGSPPDAAHPAGLVRGLAAAIPERLRDQGYGPFAAVLSHNMRQAGALRLDNAGALRRQFWVPEGAPASEGAYVSYPLHDLLGILALESRRNHCLILLDGLDEGDDDAVGAVGDRNFLFEKRLLSERDSEGALKPPEAYPESATATWGRHDQPTLAGFWHGLDLDLAGNLYPAPTPAQRETQIVRRAEDRARLLVALERAGLLPADTSVQPVAIPEMTPELVQAVHRYLARSPARIAIAQMNDVLVQAGQVQLPGMEDAYPVWRGKLELDLEHWGEEPRVSVFAEALRCERGTSIKAPVLPVPQARLPASIPRATYRLQLHADFTFDQATEILPYLDALGISHCYCSPYLKARPGSAHGYDIVDHNALNPEIGSRKQFDAFVEGLQRRGMGQILDMVPNHMGVMGSDNGWWLDVLENGPASSYARFFDIDWEPLKDELRGKVLLPVLGDHYGAVLDRGELTLVLDTDRGELNVRYYEHRFPIDPGTYPRVLGWRMERLEARIGTEDPRTGELQSLLTAFEHLPARVETDAAKVAERNRDKEAHKGRLARLYRDPDIAWFVDENIREINGYSGGDPQQGRPLNVAPLHDLMRDQAWRLAYWRVAADEINYRRFFDINELAALRMEDEAVFEATHRFVLELIARGKVQGLRIDHPDGLYNPVQYFNRLQEHVAAFADPATREHAEVSHTPTGAEDKPLYVVVEKILAGHERLPEDWPIQGTTGYEFGNLVNGLFVDPGAQSQLERIYRAFARERGSRFELDELVYDSKRLILDTSLASELNVLATQLARIAEANRHTRDYSLGRLRKTLAQVVACFPVYRTYMTLGQVSVEDRRHVDWAVAVAKKRSRAADLTVFDFVREVLLMDIAQGKDESYRDQVTAFAMKFQQYTGPVMAKGLEDTSFYIYNRLASLNEVGGEPERFGVSTEAFHHANQERAESWPHAMLGTSTHDSKRSEDVRARLDVLSEIPDRWRERLRRWARMNRAKRRTLDESSAPSRNDEYLLYQTLLGVWPLGTDGEATIDKETLGEIADRVVQYMQKAGREAKVHTSWINPNAQYEEATEAFVRALLAPGTKNLFLRDFLPFQREIARLGLFNSLSQVLLKCAVPGVPDIYQGNEIWDFSLVDPDNRRPVDYARRRAMLKRLQADLVPGEDFAARVRSLVDTMADGRSKLFLIWKVLGLRRDRPALFDAGEYLPLPVEGAREGHLVAYARLHQGETAIVAVPRLVAGLLGERRTAPMGPEVWRDTSIDLSCIATSEAANYHNVLTGERLGPTWRDGQAQLPVASVLSCFPVGLLVGGD